VLCWSNSSYSKNGNATSKNITSVKNNIDSSSSSSNNSSWLLPLPLLLQVNIVVATPCFRGRILQVLRTPTFSRNLSSKHTN
jgi:hypothetical protein